MPEALAMTTASAGFRAGPMPQTPASHILWEQAAGDLARGTFTLLGLWGGSDACRMALLDPATMRIGILTLAGQRFPSVGRLHPPAQRLERAAADLFGLDPRGRPRHPAMARPRPLGRHPPARCRD